MRDAGSGSGAKKKVSPPRGKGPLAPKPSGVFASPVKAPSVRDKPAPKPVRVKPRVGALDVLPTKGQPAKVYKPPVAKTVVRKTAELRVKQQQEAKDTKGNTDRQRAAAFLAAHPEILHPKKDKGGSGLGLATITGAAKLGEALGSAAVEGASKAAPYVAGAVAAAPTATLAGVDKVTGTHLRKFAADTISNAPKDLAELVTTTPTSLVRLGDTAIHHPEKVPGLLAQPYEDLAKDPLGTLKSHPVSTALMLAPAVKVPGRIGGRIARAAGKQSLERPPATLAGTTLKETRRASRDVVRNQVQKRTDAKNPAPQMSKGDVQRRVDEFYDFGKQKTQQITAAVHRKAEADHAHLPKDQRKAAIQTDVDNARAGVGKTIDQRFVKEFGSPWQVHPSSGSIVKPKAATEGHLHADRPSADKVAASLNANPKVASEFKVIPAGKKFGVVPVDAAERLGKQRTVGSSPAVMAKVMRRSRGALTQAVLPLSSKWLLGQGAEAGIRSAVAGAGPADLLRFNRVVKTMNKAKAGSGDELMMRVSGGQFGLTGAAREFAQGQRSLADEFAGTSLERPAGAVTRAGQKLPAKTVRKGWNKYTSVVLDSINGVIENNARKAMAGQDIKATFGDRRVLTGLSEKAIDDAAKGLQGTESQVALAREVDRMYGQYQKFSPEKRSLLMHWTPFLPWYLNTAKFLFKVLPGDHPLKAALVADVGVATEQWRKDHGLSLRGGVTKPAWQLGTYPSSGGVLGKGLVPVGKFSPFGVGTDVPGAVASLTLPQILGPIKNAGGVDWKWQQLKEPGFSGKPFTPSQKALRAIVTAVESQVPGVTQALRVSGVERKYVDRKAPDSTARQNVGKILNPLSPIPNTADTVTSSSGGKAGALPPGVSQRELDSLVKQAAAQSAAPAVSQKELDAILRSQGIRP